jgi:hypothetical protein
MDAIIRVVSMANPRPPDELSPPESQIRSEFLRGQMRQWMETAVSSGRTAELFEIEMWLRSFERFFRVKNQPLSDNERKHLAIRNWSEELRLVDNVIKRVIHLCSAILTEERVNQSWFDKYLDTYLKKDDIVDPYIERLLRQSSPEAALTLLRESFEDLHLMLTDLVKVSRVPYATFSAVGKMLYREVRRSDLLALLIDKKFKPIHDRMTNKVVVAAIRGLESPVHQKQVARVYLELFRLLHYLDYADPVRVAEEDLKNTLLLFSLVTAEARLLLVYLERKAMRELEKESSLHQLYDSFIYCLPLELKKVINTELLDISVARQTDNIRMRVENSHGILKDCFQQSVVQLTQVFNPDTHGGEIFHDFTAKLEQSLSLRDGLAVLIKAVQEFSAKADEEGAVLMKASISDFYDSSMKYLMYRDWMGFEMFFIEILKTTNVSALVHISHRFETFLMTLFREVQKRSILRELPGDNARGADHPAQ